MKSDLDAKLRRLDELEASADYQQWVGVARQGDRTPRRKWYRTGPPRMLLANGWQWTILPSWEPERAMVVTVKLGAEWCTQVDPGGPDRTVTLIYDGEGSIIGESQ